MLRKRTLSLTAQWFFLSGLAGRMIEFNPGLKMCAAADTGHNASTDTFMCVERCGHTAVCEYVMCVLSLCTVWTWCPALHWGTFPKIYPVQ